MAYPDFTHGYDDESEEVSEEVSEEDEDEDLVEDLESETDIISDDEERSPSDLRSQIWSTLLNLEKPTAFAFGSRSASLPNPGLHIRDHGLISLPLSQRDAQDIISCAKQSPFGKGEDTLVDVSVRKSWEIDGTQIVLRNPEWSRAIDIIVAAITSGLGLTAGIDAITPELYKLLIYEPGAFFKPHKDSEKVPGMFATLVVCLPSPHEGGKLVMTHDNAKYEFETESSSIFDTSFAAWYADVTHEVLPVTFGYRLVLTYNLVRKSHFISIPSSASALGSVNQLSRLLQTYNARLESGRSGLPPMLLHKLKHKYTQASLDIQALKGQDRAQIQTLVQLATSLGFDLYLATLELEVIKNDESDDYYDYHEIGDDEEIDRTQELKHVIKLDGTHVSDSFSCPEGALIDPKRQDSSKADDEEHSGWTGNEGQTATYWYRDTVVILVPPSRQIDFEFIKNPDKKRIAALLTIMTQEVSNDLSKQPKLERLCELALSEPSRTSDWSHYDMPSWSMFGGAKPRKEIPPLFKEAATAALVIGNWNLFEKACIKTDHQIMLQNGSALGRWVAEQGLEIMKHRLKNGVQAAPSLAEKARFLQEIEEGFNAAVQTSGIDIRQDLKRWSDTILFEATAESQELSKKDGVAIAKLQNNMDWNFFELKATPILLTATTAVKIAFVNTLMSEVGQNPEKKHLSFAGTLLENIWNTLKFDTGSSQSSFGAGERSNPNSLNPYFPNSSLSNRFLSSTSLPGYSGVTIHPDAKDLTRELDVIQEGDLVAIIGNTGRILPSCSVNETIIPAILNAVLEATEDTAKETFIPFVRTILRGKVHGFDLLKSDAKPPKIHKNLIAAMLTRYIQTNVGSTPEAPVNWTLPTVTCYRSCEDCADVNNFLRHPTRVNLDITGVEPRRKHLDSTFNWGSNNEKQYDIVTVRTGRPYTWRITKHRRHHEQSKSVWQQKVRTARTIISGITHNAPERERLEAYLDPYFASITEVDVNNLPNLEVLVKEESISESNPTKTSTPASKAGHKRKASSIDLVNVDGPAKRTRAKVDSDKLDDLEDKENNPKVEVVDLTEM